MKIYLIYIFFLLLYFFVSTYIITFYNKSDILTIIVLYWMMFCVLIGLLELVLFFKDKYISQLPKYSKTNYWLRDIKPNELFNFNIWSHGWKEYGELCDSRYLKTKNLVHWLEITHSFTSFIYIYIIYKLITVKNIIKNRLIGILMMIISSIHIIGTFIYFLTFNKYLKKNPIKKTTKFWIYLFSNFLWFIMPIIVLVKGYKIM